MADNANLLDNYLDTRAGLVARNVVKSDLSADKLNLDTCCVPAVQDQQEGSLSSSEKTVDGVGVTVIKV